MNRRNALRALAGVISSTKLSGILACRPALARFPQEPFQPTHESLATYQVPQWFLDAKFGIWAHWGPQSAAEDGDWYARNMYIQASDQYNYHVRHYGHPSKCGFKDIIPTWKAMAFDPDHLVGLYKKAGAKYFVSMGVHHDNFDLWNSKHTRWNSVNMGPKRDVVAEFRKAAQKHGLRFGVSDHLWISYKWFAVSHMSDAKGPLAEVPYDGTEPQNADLYHSYSDPALITQKFEWNEDGISQSWKEEWFRRISDLVEQAQPDYLYSDGQLPFGELGLRMAAKLYNLSAQRNGGRTEAVYLSKRAEDCAIGTCVLDHERGVLDEISANPWQTDTCIGNWHYARGIRYKSPKFIVDMLVDVVSRNGNLMLNFPLPNSGMLDDRELRILAEITDWMNVNGKAIYATRPWKILGSGPSTEKPKTPGAKTNFNEKDRKDLSSEDIRFTVKGDTLFVFVMGLPEKEAIVPPLAATGKFAVGTIVSVELLGYPGKLVWRQDASGLTIQLPESKPCKYALAFRVRGAI
ncbi:MAG: alpha-L-fucosidase [Candidatus Acidiferrum sp.]|jgi:alpha-L-fucosidase